MQDGGGEWWVPSWLRIPVLMGFLVAGWHTTRILGVEGIPSYAESRGRGMRKKYRPQIVESTKLS